MKLRFEAAPAPRPPGPRGRRGVGLCLLALALALAWAPATRAQPAPTNPSGSASSAEPTGSTPSAKPTGTAPSAKPTGTAPPSAAPTAAPAGALTPPRLLQAVDAQYPPEAWAQGLQADLSLAVTITRTGTVAAATVLKSGGPAFDAAAIAAARRWRFAPATRGGQPIPARIRLPFRFSHPTPALGPATASQAGGQQTGAQQAGSRPAAPEQAGPNPASGPRSRPANHRPSPPDPLAASPASTRTATAAAGLGISPVAPDPQADLHEPHSVPGSKLSDGGGEVIELTVRGTRQRRVQERSTADFQLDQEVLVAAPRKEGDAVLTAAPGMYVARAEGPAVAQRYMLRGFDAEHGQDLEFKVGGLPINLPGHIHGQGYADLGFLIPEVIDSMDVSEGVYDPSQGDFAVAGSFRLKLGVKRRGIRARTSVGAFGALKQLILWAPPAQPDASFAAAQLSRSDGFGENRRGEQLSVITQQVAELGSLRLRLIGIARAARAQLAGLLRNDDVQAGRVCRLCSYPFPTARGQDAQAGRILLGLFLEHDDPEGGSGELGLWLGYDSFSLKRNFTGFIKRSRTLGVTGRGDLIAQFNRTLSFGLDGRLLTAATELLPWARMTLEMGVGARLDAIEQRQDLLDAGVHLQRWDERVNASLLGLDLSMWGDLSLQLLDRITARLGYRADLLSYSVHDHLGNFAAASRPQDSFLRGFYRSAAGFAAGPRTSLELQVISRLTAQLAYGEGYRSPQPRILENGERAPFTRVRSADLGLRWDGGEALQLAAGAFYTQLSDDIAFSAAEGRMERIGATRRLGAVGHALARPYPWLIASVSLTFVQATLLEPPPATAEEPQPPFTSGQRLPYIPPLLFRADIAASHRLLPSLWGRPLDGRAGLGASVLSGRPLPYSQSSDAVALVDASVGLSWAAVSLSFEVFNLLDTEYEALSFSFASDWDPTDGVRTRTPARHFAAGAPRSWLVSAEIQL